MTTGSTNSVRAVFFTVLAVMSCIPAIFMCTILAVVIPDRASFEFEPGLVIDCAIALLFLASALTLFMRRSWAHAFIQLPAIAGVAALATDLPRPAIHLLLERQIQAGYGVFLILSVMLWSPEYPQILERRHARSSQVLAWSALTFASLCYLRPLIRSEHLKFLPRPAFGELNSIGWDPRPIFIHAPIPFPRHRIATVATPVSRLPITSQEQIRALSRFSCLMGIILGLFIVVWVVVTPPSHFHHVEVETWLPNKAVKLSAPARPLQTAQGPLRFGPQLTAGVRRTMIIMPQVVHLVRVSSGCFPCPCFSECPGE